MRLATTAIHVGQDPDPVTGATVPPIHVTSTYTQESPGVHKGYEYSRTANPTRVALEKCLAAIEGGAAATAFPSGLAATTAMLATLRPGDSVVSYGDVYGGTYRLMETVFRPWGLDARFTDDPDPKAFDALIDKTTKLIWLETPTNPLLRVLDIKAIADVAHARGVRLAVDNTFATPALQQPLTLGADYVVHSSTKYLGGHSDVIGGAVICKQAEWAQPIAYYLNAAGSCPGPFDAYLTHRGIKTLKVRMDAHCQNAAAIAEHLMGHGALSKVIYPKLMNHPDHAIASRQMSGGGGIVTMEFKNGFAAAKSFCERVKVFSLAESLGGVESLVNHPAIMTHASIPKEIREARGVTDGLVRLSVGIEDTQDLIEDLEQALG
ncbi:MAG: cystathionine gamma-synthase [Phycisphaerales bacterium]|nr:cystathionine gamma-synthase [Phycisphaerales bacterium]